MSIKILGGVAKGHSLEVPKGNDVRPTSVMLRRKIFDAHQHLDEFHFIDLCAGTGAMGAEALSRGASSLIAVEGSKKVATILKKNFHRLDEKCNLANEKVMVQIMKAEKWISQFTIQYSHWDEERKENTILFFDPPYELLKLYKQLIEEILEKDWFKGQFWLESDDQKGVKESSLVDHEGVTLKKVYRQGTSYIAIYDCRDRQ